LTNARAGDSSRGCKKGERECNNFGDSIILQKPLKKRKVERHDRNIKVENTGGRIAAMAARIFTTKTD